MDLNSKYFDKIRINKGRKKDEAPKVRTCQWAGCDKPGSHRAPMGRGREGEYYELCIDHVREYNKSYNYFSGLDDDAVVRFQKDALTGHRPTWTMGVNRWGNQPPIGGGADASQRIEARARGRARPAGGRTRKLKTLEKKAFETLNLPHTASDTDIRSRYKELVKRHHPDANGGDRSSEDRLRQIIQSYKYLKQMGFC